MPCASNTTEKPERRRRTEADDEPEKSSPTFALTSDCRASAATLTPRSTRRRSSSTRPTSRRPRRRIRWSCTRRRRFGTATTSRCTSRRKESSICAACWRRCSACRRRTSASITKFVGSGFGSKLFPWTHCPLAAAAARELGKPVKLVVSRKMMFQTVGHRPRTQQRVRLGATQDGKLVSLQHDYVYHARCSTSTTKIAAKRRRFMYSVPNLRVTFGRAKRNIGAASDYARPRRRSRNVRHRVGDQRTGRSAARSIR